MSLCDSCALALETGPQAKPGTGEAPGKAPF